MKLVLEKAADFQKSIDAIAVLIDEAEFILDESGLALKATDPSQISMVDFFLEKAAFKEFDVKEKAKIGLDLDYLRQIMSRAKADDELTIELDAEQNKLNVKFKGTSTRKFNLPLIDISSAELPNPKIEFDAEVKLVASVLQDALKDASLISSHVSVGIMEDAMSMFPLDYLQDMMKAAQSATVVQVNLKANAPIEISYEIGKSKIKYFLAPRIES